MPNRKAQLRRRTIAKASSKNNAEIGIAKDGQPEAKRTFKDVARSFVISVVRILGPCVAGLLSATAITSEIASTVFFVATLITLFVILFLAFLSILKERNTAMIELPTVYKADGAVIKQEPMSVFEHDRKVATYYSTELPVLALAAVWFRLWAQSKWSFLIYAAYVAHRVFNHPLFRIHVWKETDSPDLQRPFGLAPLFTAEDKSVNIIEGSRAFHEALRQAPRDSVVIADFSAAWCAPCKAMAPVFKEMAEEIPEGTFLTIDIDVSQDLAMELEISSVPSFLLFKDGERVELLRGASPEALRSAIRMHL